ncbi:MAG: nucleotidyltransferase domain-containing protein [Chloroflexi bacterium]|nr:nucleotidyltransferase domain-containing protein [Chloroflexota bacterium]
MGLVLPIGTHVVTRVETKDTSGESVRPRGAVGVVVDAPTDAIHAYRVRFVDGGEAWLCRQELSIRKHVQRFGLEQAESPLAEYDLQQYVIYRCVVGSRAYGLGEAGSDVDRRGIYLPPAELHWSLWGVPETLQDRGKEEVYRELQKFLTLALKANPNVLECLYTPLVEYAAPPAEELLAMRDAFLSKLVYQTYNGYVLSQFKKLEQDVRTTGALKWKHVMHLIRLLLSGVTILKEETVPVNVEAHRARLLAIRRAEVPWEEVNAWRLRLHREFDAAYATTRLPERPDYVRVNAFLVKARRSMV